MAWTTPKTWTPAEVVTAQDLNTHVRDNLLAVVPVGTVLPFAGSSAPNSLYLLCNGAAVSRTTYAALFSLIGTTYGTGDGSTTFNLPDMQGRVPVGLNSGGPAEVNGLGDNEGAAVAARTIKHFHKVSINASPSGANNNTPFSYGDIGISGTPQVHNTTGGGSQDNPAFLTLNYIIKALQ